MRLDCPNCGARYAVDDAAIPAAGRAMHCSACDHRWFHRPAAAVAPDPGSAPPDGFRPRATDPTVLQILREEAARELAARRRVAAGDAPRDAAGPAAAPRDTAPPETETPAQLRRALLPDIDEVSSTLQPGSGAKGGATIVMSAPEAPSRGGFVAGFTFTLVLALVGWAVYHWAADLAEMVPALADPLASYVAAIDALRAAIRSAAG